MKTKFTVLAVVTAAWIGAQCVVAAEPSVADLLASLKSSDESVRAQAEDALAERGPEAAAAVEPLTALLADKSAVVRAHAVRAALGMIGAAAKSAVPQIVELAGDEDPVVRRQAVQAIKGINPGPKVTVPLCVKLLEDADPGVRQRVLMTVTEAGQKALPGLKVALDDDKAAYWACIILRDMGPEGKEAIPGLAKRLQDERPDVRREAVLALASMGDAASDVVPQIAALLDDPDAAVAATYALGRIGHMPKDVDATVAKNARDTADPMLSTTSLWALANTHPDDKKLRGVVTKALIEQLKSDDPYVRAAAARGLAALPPAPEVTLPIWKEELQNADETLLAHALDALIQLGAPAVPALAKGLEYDTLRPQIISVLYEMGPNAAAASPALAKLVNTDDERIAHEAIITLASVGPAAEPAVPALVEALETDGNPNAHAAVYAVGRVGPAARDAKDHLLKLLKGSDQDLALIALVADQDRLFAGGGRRGGPRICCRLGLGKGERPDADRPNRSARWARMAKPPFRRSKKQPTTATSLFAKRPPRHLSRSRDKIGPNPDCVSLPGACSKSEPQRAVVAVRRGRVSGVHGAPKSPPSARGAMCPRSAVRPASVGVRAGGRPFERRRVRRRPSLSAAAGRS
ncbi:MAG: HEAT repeat domain-containing protein [Pirellulales bacterium]